MRRGAVQEQVQPAGPAGVLDVAVRVRGVGVQQADVGSDGRHGDQGLTGDRIGEQPEIGVQRRQRRADAAAPGQERQPLARGFQAAGQDSLLAFPHLDLTGLDGAAERRRNRHADAATGVVAHGARDTAAGDQEVEREPARDRREPAYPAAHELADQGHRRGVADGDRHAVFDQRDRVAFRDDVLTTR